mmetsp:Transcript_19864/g.50100  ORF Transcript_19864/g.50100 Transcript_19864/m.50100 type:complete len:247 (-) Transcript_19864:1408-2148(-)
MSSVSSAAISWVGAESSDFCVSDTADACPKPSPNCCVVEDCRKEFISWPPSFGLATSAEVPRWVPSTAFTVGAAPTVPAVSPSGSIKELPSRTAVSSAVPFRLIDVELAAAFAWAPSTFGEGGVGVAVPAPAPGCPPPPSSSCSSSSPPTPIDSPATVVFPVSPRNWSAPLACDSVNTRSCCFRSRRSSRRCSCCFLLSNSAFSAAMSRTSSSGFFFRMRTSTSAGLGAFRTFAMIARSVFSTNST